MLPAFNVVPPAYVFEGMRGVLLTHRVDWSALSHGAGLAAAELLLAAYVYGRVYRHAVRTGLLARYSAEGAA